MVASNTDHQRGYALAPLSCAERLWDAPRHPLPTIRVGRWLKLSFSAVPLCTPKHIESMWVRLESIDGETLRGRLDNDPDIFADRLTLGDEIEFSPRHVNNVHWERDLVERSLDHVCEVCDLDLRRKNQELDTEDECILDNIRRFGFHLLEIPGDDEGPGFVWSIGFEHLYKHPEILIFGDSPMGIVLGAIGDRICQGERFEHGDELNDLFSNARARFVLVAGKEEVYREHFGYASWFYQSWDFRVLQLQWSDRQGRFPGDPDFDDRFVQLQPNLA